MAMSSTPASLPAEGDSVELGLLEAAPPSSLAAPPPGISCPRTPHLFMGLIMGAALCAALLSERGLAGTSSWRVRQSSISLQGAQCMSVQPGDSCDVAVQWAMSEGIRSNPGWYPTLTTASSFTEFQHVLFENGRGGCLEPCQGAVPAVAAQSVPAQQAMPAQAAAPAQQPVVVACLCLFDIGRTLTTKQGASAQCPASEPQPGVTDTARGGGELVLSPVGARLEETSCGQCHRGIVSAGEAGGPEEKAVLQKGGNFPDAVGTEWSFPGVIKSPLIRRCGDAEKAKCAKGMVDWFASARQIQIAPENVFFFDDQTGNTNGWADYGFNARQISCASRDPAIANTIGLCGAQMDELVLQPGIYNCP